MGSLSFAEIITILLVVLIVFGPNRLPEFARKLGELMAQARRATSQFSKDISTEWGDAVEPIRAAKDDYDGVKKDLKDATAAITGFGTAETAGETTDAEDDDGLRTTDDGPEPEETTDAGDDDGLRTTDDGPEPDETTDAGDDDGLRTTDDGPEPDETTEHGTRTTDAAEDDQSSVPLSRDTEETTDAEDDYGLRTTDDGPEPEETSGRQGEAGATESQGADTELGEA